MHDGHLNKCKACAKADVFLHRSLNIEKIREYDRGRGNRQPSNYSRKYAERYPLKNKATTMVGNYIRDKKLFKKPCEQCGTLIRIHAHHDDYFQPLRVRWLCAAHHRQWHVKNGEGKNSF